MTKTPEGDELKANWKHDAQVRTITQSEINKHKTKNDLWIVIHGNVYDVSEYVKDHPGGPDPLIEVGGQDATSAYEDVGHSEDAREILNSFLIGHLEGYTAPEKADISDLPEVQMVQKSSNSESGKHTIHLGSGVELAAIVLGAAGLLYAASSYRLLPAVTRSISTGNNGFFVGFSTAALTIGLAGLAGARYLNQFTQLSGFQSYPAHIPSTGAHGTWRVKGALHPSEYRKFILRSKKELADSIWLFVFDLPSKYSILGLPVGQHVAVKGVVDEHTVVRSYTPISGNRDLGRLELLIKVYPDGKLGNHLKNTAEGAEVEIRGPKGAMKYRRDMAKRIGMIGGGTGITPLFQVIRAVCEDKNDKTSISLLYGNRSESDIMLRDKLDGYARDYPDKFSVHYVLNDPPAGWTGGKGHVDKDLIQKRLPAPDQDSKILLCGPPGMVKAMTSSLVELGFDQPNTVARMTDQVKAQASRA